MTERTRERGRKRKYDVETQYQVRLQEGMTSYLRSLDLKPSEGTKVPTGTSILQNTTKKDYEKHFRGFTSFCSKIGDYESILVTYEHSPDEFCPSMKPESIALYLRFKRWKNGTILKSFTTEEVVNDIFGEPVLCDGGWNDPGNANQFLSAITTAHRAINQSGAFKSPCNSCIESWRKNSNSNGCRFHPGDIRVWRNGNPRDSQIVKNAYRENTKELFEYVVKGSYQLLPIELKEMRTLLLSTNTLEDVQLFCIILVSIHLFLRHDEFSNIKVEDIQRDLSVIKENGVVESIVIRVCGKTDKIWRNLILWRKDDVPEFCPIRHLLSYVHLAKIENGYLFPNLKDRTKKHEYNGLLKLLKDRFSNILDRNSSITTHTFRKTGYLFAHWGGASMETTMASARHMNSQTAMVYKQDCETQLHMAEGHDPKAKFQVPRFKMSIIENELSGRRLNESSLKHFRSLYQLSQTFIDQIGIFEEHRRRNAPHFVLEEAVSHRGPTDLDEDLQNLLKNSVPNNVAEEINHIFVQLIQREKRRVRTEMESSAAETLVSLDGSTSTQVPTAIPPQTNKRGGQNDLPLRFELKKKGMGAIELLLQIDSEIPDDLESLTNGARTFYFTVLNPVLSCLRHHFNSDCQAFLSSWSLQKGVSSFRKKCCKGKAESNTCHL